MPDFLNKKAAIWFSWHRNEQLVHVSVQHRKQQSACLALKKSNSIIFLKYRCE